MRIAVLVATMLYFTSTSFAQTSCSSRVPKEICSTVTVAMAPLDHVILKGTAFPVELVTPEEYKKRLDDYQEEGIRNDKSIIMPACDRKGKSDPWSTPQCVNARTNYFAGVPVLGLTHTRVMYNGFTEDVTFLRDHPTSTRPDRILMSTNACMGLGKQLPPDKNGVVKFAAGDFEPDAVFRMTFFIIGFIEGTYANSLN